MITQPRSLLLQGLQFAQMAAFCIKGTGPQWAAGAAGVSVLINVLWPSAAKPQAITQAQLDAALKKLQAGLSAVVWSGFQSTYQANLDSAISEWNDVFNDMASGKLDIDTTTPTGQVNAQAWNTFTNKALNYGTWTSSNPLPQVWNWAADQAVLQKASVKPEATRLQLFSFYSSAAGCFLVWAQLALFSEYIEINQKVTAARKAGNANAAKGKPDSPNDNPNSPYFVAQQQALDLFIAYTEGGTVSISDASGPPKKKSFPGVLPIVRKGQKALAPAVAAAKSSAAYKAIVPTLDSSGYFYLYPDPVTNQPVKLPQGYTFAQAQTACDQVKRMLVAEAIAKVEDQYCLNVLSNTELASIEDTLAKWKESQKHLATIARRHHN